MTDMLYDVILYKNIASAFTTFKVNTHKRFLQLSLQLQVVEYIANRNICDKNE